MDCLFGTSLKYPEQFGVSHSTFDELAENRLNGAYQLSRCCQESLSKKVPLASLSASSAASTNAWRLSLADFSGKPCRCVLA